MAASFRIALLFLLAAAALPAETLRVATYNLRNYLVMDRMVDGRWRPEYPKPEAEKAVIRDIISEVAPDILVLQEIGGADFLEELRLDLHDEGLDYPYALLMEGEDETRHVALLSRVEPVGMREHSDLDFKYFEQRLKVKRGLLEVSFELPDGQIFKLFGLHLKSRWSDEPRDPGSDLRRAKEAEASRNRMIERTLEADTALYLVAGDFNDHPASSALRRFYQKGDLTLGVLLPIADSRGHVWTHFYEKHATYSQVDGFVVSPALMPMIETGAGQIVDRPGALRGSDHRMVYFDF